MIFCAVALSSVDKSPASTLSAIDLQRKSMRLFASAPWEFLHDNPRYSILSNNIMNHFKAKLAPTAQKGPDDVCMWNGVKCTGTIVTGVHLSHEAKEAVVAVEWLPPTVEHIHFDGGVTLFRGWVTRRLPRALTYLYLRSCKPIEREELVDLRTLPAHMEELIVMYHWQDGQVYLDALPDTMRILYIRSALHINCQVNYALLPEKMALAWILPSTTETKIDFQVYGKVKRDPRVRSAGKFSAVVECSKYFSVYDA